VRGAWGRTDTYNSLAIETQNLRKVYKEAEALKGLSLTVRQHSIFGFLGPNGAGTTNLMRILGPTTDAAAPETTDALGVVTVNRLPFSLIWPVSSGTSLHDSFDDPLV
jgi:ABC-type phosphate transport system ATPase subunit